MTNIAKTLSAIFHPIAIPLYCAILMYVATALPHSNDIYADLAFFALVILFTVVVPVVSIWYRYRKGKITDITLPDRRERHPIYLISLNSAIVGLYSIYLLLGMYLYVTFFTFALFAFAAVTIINTKWKISAHSCGMGILCGFVVIMSFLHINIVFWSVVTLLIAGSVMTSRCILGAHTLGQTVAGFFLGLGLSLIPSVLLWMQL